MYLRWLCMKTTCSVWANAGFGGYNDWIQQGGYCGGKGVWRNYFYDIWIQTYNFNHSPQHYLNMFFFVLPGLLKRHLLYYLLIMSQILHCQIQFLLVFPYNKSLLSLSRCVNIQRDLKHGQKCGWIHSICAVSEVWNELLCLFFALTCKENENQACSGVFQWCEAFLNLYLSAFYCNLISWRGRVRPLHCNCLCLMCTISHWQDI